MALISFPGCKSDKVLKPRGSTCYHPACKSLHGCYNIMFKLLYQFMLTSMQIIMNNYLSVKDFMSKKACVDHIMHTGG